MIVTAKFDTKHLNNALGKRNRGFKDTLREAMNDIGRLVAVSLATSAQPYGLSENSRKQGEIAVRRDIYRIYCTPSMVYGEISNKDADAARNFYKMMRNGLYSEALALINQLAPKFSLVQIRPFDDGALHKARRNKRGRVPASQKHLMLVTNPAALQKYVQKKINRVGSGKAGWGNCAKKFRAGRAATRGLPGWVTRHNTAPTDVAINDVDGRVIIVMQNNLPYASELMTPDVKDAAVQYGIARMVRSVIIAEARAKNSPLS